VRWRPELDALLVSAQIKHITIDVLVDGDEISGQAGDRQDAPMLFIGWLGLIWVLDELLGVRSSTAAEQATSH
jgi:hypothetical protein